MPQKAKELQEYLGQVIDWQGRKANEAAARAESKLHGLAERDKARAERARAREEALKEKYPSIKKGR